ncbi:PhzF family isomerase [Peribacillus butanolivorans]|uniref:PhzF family isomerase n=1 Tax=Peribacillus butanolivorans TaxID=421767 RepID=UPI003642EE24
MARKYRLYQIDSFTKEKLSGNPAGVITNADGLSSGEMQRIARELNNSETAFIFKSDNSESDVHIRFFTPTHEVPICGHATIAAHYARAVENSLNTGKVYHKTGAGILPVDVIKEDNDYKIIMTQGSIRFDSVIDGLALENIFTAFNISENDLLKDCPVQIVSTGHSKVMIGIENSELLHRLNPNMDLLTKVSGLINCNGFYVFTMNAPDSEILIHGRMFAPAIGINEDPVTGNANGPLGAYLIHHGLVKHDNTLFSFKAVQGEAINRAGVIDVQVKICNQEPEEVRIAGNAVIVFKSELLLD